MYKRQALADAAVARFGRIDTWINNAGIGMFGRLDETSEADARRLFDVNFWSIVNGSLIALPYLKQNGGTLINLGSEVSEGSVPLQGMYGATKHAAVSYTHLDVYKRQAQAGIELLVGLSLFVHPLALAVQ